MSARDVVLARIRAALSNAPPHPTPIPRVYRTGSDLGIEECADRFAARVDDYQATVHRSDYAHLAEAIAAIVTAAGTRSLAVPRGLSAAWLAGIDQERITIIRDFGEVTARELDRVDAVLTGSAIAIAETGTVVLDAGDDQGRRALTLLPDHHVCVVMLDRVVATVPEGLARLDPTQPLTLISGPSATSDIELDRVEGVHGPRTLDVIICNGRSP